jgi:hypothetical protein
MPDFYPTVVPTSLESVVAGIGVEEVVLGKTWIAEEVVLGKTWIADSFNLWVIPYKVVS